MIAQVASKSSAVQAAPSSGAGGYQLIHELNTLYTVDHAARFAAQLNADGYHTQPQGAVVEIYAMIHITANGANQLNPRPIQVAQLTGDGKLRVGDNTADRRFTRYLYAHQNSCAVGEGCSTCNWCRLKATNTGEHSDEAN